MSAVVSVDYVALTNSRAASYETNRSRSKILFDARHASQIPGFGAEPRGKSKPSSQAQQRSACKVATARTGFDAAVQ